MNKRSQNLRFSKNPIGVWILLFSLTTLLVSVVFLSPVTAQTGITQVEIPGEAFDVVWRPDGEVLAIGTGAGIKLYDSTLQEIATLPGYANTILEVDWNPDGTYIVGAGLEDNVIPVWHQDGATGRYKLERTLTVSLETWDIDQVVWNPSGTYLAAISTIALPSGVVGSIHLWNTSTWTLERTLNDQYWFPGGTLVWNPDGTELAGSGTEACDEAEVCVDDPVIFIVDFATGNRVLEIPTIDTAHSLLWLSENRIAASAGYNKIQVYNTETGKRLNEVGFDASWLAISPNRQTLAIGAIQGVIEIRDLATDMLLLTLTVPETLYDIAWSPNGTQLASAHDGVVRLWDVSSLPAIEGIPTLTPYPNRSLTPTPTPTS